MHGKVALVAVAALLFDVPLQAENYAFLVAVQDYNVKSLKPLKFTRNDIEAFEKVLHASGFKPENIVLMTDQPRQLRYAAEAEKIRRQLDSLLIGLEAKDTLVVAFAGHGVQYEGDPKNYFCPIDADLEDIKRTRLIALSEIYDKLKECPASRKLLVVDACRKEPQSDIARSRETVKLKSVTRPQGEPVPKGVVAVFSCSAGQEAFEWPELKHGIFFHHFLEGWEGAAAQNDQVVTLDQVVAYSKLQTQNFARSKLDAAQTPQISSDFQGTWILKKFDKGKELLNSLGMKFVLIPPGEFLMGNEETLEQWQRVFPKAVQAWFDVCGPQHRVKISRSFYLGKYEVTRGQFQQFVKATNYVTDAERDGKGGHGLDAGDKEFKGPKPAFSWRFNGTDQTDDHPVVNVSWNDAVEFCRWLSQKERQLYRLPTEAEWEYACRAGTLTRYHCGDDPDSMIDFANVADATAKDHKSSWTTISGRDGYLCTAPVGKFRANRFGLHDMHGNVWEWCNDRFDMKYYQSSPVLDPEGAETGTTRVYRGGSWLMNPALCRSAQRGSDASTVRGDGLGFRVVQILPAVQTETK